jgi:hypothetical protein
LPAFLINSTVVEKGQLISFSTTQFPSAKYQGKHVTVRYDQVLGNFDLAVATAARMSATFPYVSPAAGPAADEIKVNGYHLVDGGYYDNYGLIGLSQWLDDALESLGSQDRPAKIAVLTIRSFPDALNPEPGTWGWLRQIPAPLGAFLQVRSYAQWEGANEQLALLRQKWEKEQKTPVLIQLFDVQYPAESALRCGEPPLSWKLTSVQQSCVEAAVKNSGVQSRIRDLLTFVGVGQAVSPAN